LSQEELEGVLAHEITHIANGDMVTMTLIQGVVNAFVMFLARALAFAISNVGGKRENTSYMGYTLLVVVFQIVFMILGSIVVAWFSRLREYRADRGGAHLAGKEKMIHALQALERMHDIRDPMSQKHATFEALQIHTSSKSIFRFFASHPSIIERIARLQEL